MPRRQLSKKLRFEVFKRDKFRCQYCGRPAPDVVLQVDHVEPVAKGGKNNILNLLTSCSECNAGKGARTLADDSVLAKQRAQMEQLQERREQIQMLIDWQRSLVDLDADAVKQAEAFWCDLADWHCLSETGRGKLRTHLRRHGLDRVLTAMRASTHYFQYDDDGHPTEESSEVAFNKIGGICAIQLAEQSNPDIKNVFYIRGVLRNRFNYVDLSEAKALLEEAFTAGLQRDGLYDMACHALSWTDWRNTIIEVINNARDGNGAH